MKISIYSTPTCPWCVLVKNYFKSKKIDFVDINVAIDPLKAKEMIDISGQTGVPVIVVEKDENDNEPTVIHGFDKEAIEKILNSTS